jgi:predicted permease
MRWWGIIKARLRALRRREAVLEDIEEEMRLHVELERESLVEHGIRPDEAWHRAHRNFGNLPLIMDLAYEVRGGGMLEQLRQDQKYSLRMLFKDRAFSIVAILTLALGIGANTAMFSVLYTYLFRPLPYPQSNQLVRVWRTSHVSQSWPHNFANFADQRAKNKSFEHLTAMSWSSYNLAEPGAPAERVQAIIATADFFPTLGVEPARGHVFTTAEEVPGASDVVVLSNNFWMRHFQGDPNIVGRKLRMDGTDRLVLGVMPPGFEYPLLWGPIDVWTPLALTAEQRASRNNNWLTIIGRLKQGVTLKQAQADMTGLAAAFVSEKLQEPTESLRLELLHHSMSGDVIRSILWFTFGLAGFVLLIACANVANLQLVRTATRAREYALRAALGAQRGRLLRQSLIESLTVSLIGGGISLLFAVLAVDFINSRLFAELPGARVSLDVMVFAFALAASVLTGLVFGMVPAWMAARSDINQVLKSDARSSTGTRSHNRLRRSLVVVEVAFALVLVTGAGLLIRGVERFMNIDPGWRVDGLLTAQMTLQGTGYDTKEKRRAFSERLSERLTGLPGVQRVSISNSNPVWGFQSSGPVLFDGQPNPPEGQLPEVSFEPINQDYFAALGVRLLEGRPFAPSDTSDKPDVGIINQTMAKRFWPNESAIGKRFHQPGAKKSTEVVGVINDMSFPASLIQPYTNYQAFRPITQVGLYGGLVVGLRTSVSPESLSNAVRRTVADLDPDLSVFEVRSARSIVDRGLGNVSLLGALLGAFALIGFGLAALGIYGVTSYTVAQRTGEIGIRLALGAQRKDVLRLVVVNGVGLITAGAVIGVGGAYAVARMLESTIPTLPTRDPMTIVVTTVLLVVVALIACWLPARRASRVDPMVALRHE